MRCRATAASMYRPSSFYFFVQLAVNSADDDVHGDNDCDTSEHTYCTVEHDLHSGQESRPSGVRCGSYFTAHSHGKISFSGMLGNGLVD